MKLGIPDAPLIGKAPRSGDKLLRDRFGITFRPERSLSDASTEEVAKNGIKITIGAEQRTVGGFPVNLNPIGNPDQVISNFICDDIGDFTNQ